MKGTRYLIAMGLIGLMGFAGCSKEETAEDPGTTRGVNENDSTGNGGSTFTLNTEWEDSVEMGF